MNFKQYFYLSIGIFISFVSLNTGAQTNKTGNLKVTTNKFDNWHNMDPKINKIQGISTDEAYSKLLKGKKMTPVIVAVIDGGVDVNHEDLKGKIWINQGEIPGNGIDDDHNGFIDDINGWNFIGGKDGKNVKEETAEITRLYVKFIEKFDGKKKSSLSGNELTEYEYLEKAKDKYLEKANKSKRDLADISSFSNAFWFSDSIVKSILNKADYTLEDIKTINPGDDKRLTSIKEFLSQVYKKGFDRDQFKKYTDYINTKTNYHYNTDFNPRTIVGDNPEVWDDTPYGNNDVIGNSPEHGTFVSGIIAANRHNDIGIKGIADSVKIMVIRTIPDGDERDKDVANAIIYAVKNGAQILNLSFGKDFSPQKKFVDDALRFAASKDVLIIHAAGNDSENTDTLERFPNNHDQNGNIIMENWMNIGASFQKKNKTLTGDFSNYGKKTVEFFAPGVNIYSTEPGNKYGVMDGTSFSSPMTAGAAALLKSVYPTLHAAQIKEILMKSTSKYPHLRVYMPNQTSKKKDKTRFGKLSVTGGVLNVYNALELAEKYTTGKINLQ
jgi:cell wall-associated protease